MAEDSTTKTTTPGTEDKGEQGKAGLPSLDFSTFILSLSSSVLINLGVLEHPVTKKSEKDTAAAKQTIDLISLLQEKTRGNLTDDEARLIEDLLTELRLQYCKAMEEK